MKKHKVLYLLGLFVLLMREWSLKPFGFFSTDVHLIITLSYMLLGVLIYRNSGKGFFKEFGKKEFSWIVFGIVLSMLPAWLYHDQTLVQSLITYRFQLYWLIIPLIYKISPTEDEMIRFFNYGSFILIFVYFLKITNLGLFVLDEELTDRLLSGIHTYTVIGYWIFTIPIFWNLMKIRDNFSWQSLISIMICYFFIFLMENRSTLFPITIIISYVFLFAIKSRNKIILVLFFLLIVVFVAYQTQDEWISLIDETMTQVDDEDYARNMEIAYYLSSDANPGILTYFLGNGLISRHGNSWVDDLWDLKIFNSDVGFVGFWNFYGLIPVLVFIYTMIYAIIKKKIPYYLKLWAVQMLACSLTISYYGSAVWMSYYAMFFYLLHLNKAKVAYDNHISD